MIIAVDFDGTVVTHEYPNMGQDIGATQYLLAAVDLGAKLILHTVRDGKELEDAVQWFERRGIALYGVNDNPNQHEWSTSRKIHANLFIDDLAFGVPLVVNNKDRPFVDWNQVGPAVLSRITEARKGGVA